MAGKYNNRRTEIDGIMFDSRGEASRYVVLRDREARGEIDRLEIQVPYHIIVEGTKVGKYISDFRYVKDGKIVIEDFKSTITAKNPVFRLKQKLVKALYGITIYVTFKANDP